jgi:hypothetical protein
MSSVLTYQPVFRRASFGDGSVIECVGTDAETAAVRVQQVVHAVNMLPKLVGVLEKLLNNADHIGEELPKTYNYEVARAVLAEANNPEVK